VADRFARTTRADDPKPRRCVTAARLGMPASLGDRYPC